MPIRRAEWKDTVLKRLVASLAAIAALFLIGVPAARAAAIEVSIDTVVRAEEGSITALATTDTPPDLIGMSCLGVATATNQPSVHPRNDLIVTSGDSSMVLKDVERAPGAITTAESLLSLGPIVTVSLRMGPDEVFSGGLVLTIDECTPPTTTTTTTTTEPPTTTTTTEPPTTEPPTTTIAATTITRPPQTTVPPTLPNTGVSQEKLTGIGVAGFVFFLSGIALLSVAAQIGHLRVRNTGTPTLGLGEVVLTIALKPQGRTIYIPLRPATRDPEPRIN